MARMRQHGQLATQARWLWAVVALALVSGCAELPAAAKQQKLDAENAYRNQNYQAATNTLNTLLAQYPDHPESAEAYYLRALCHVKQSNKARATEDAQQCVRLSKQPDLTAKACAMAGELLSESGKSAAAISHFAEALKKLPETPPTDLVRYRYAICLQREGRWAEARQQYTAICKGYPSSSLAEPAKRMLEWPYDYFVVQCGAFRDKAEAAKLVEKIKQSGLKPRIETRSRSGETLQVVCVGQYPRYDQAQEACRAVQRQVKDASIAP